MPDITITIKAEVAKLRKDLGKAKKEINKLSKSTKTAATSTNKLSKQSEKLSNRMGSLKKVTGLFNIQALAAAAGLAMLIAGVKSAINAFQAQEQAEARLVQALKNQNAFTEKNITSLKLLASQLQQTTIFGDEQTISAMAMLASFKLNAAQIATITPIMQDLATMTSKVTGEQMDLEGVAKLVGLALEGQAGRLKQAGISLTNLETAAINAADRQQKLAIITGVMEKNAKDLAVATGRTATAALQRFSNTLGDLREVIGEVIVLGMQESVTSIESVVRAFINISKEMKGTSDTAKEQSESMKILQEVNDMMTSSNISGAIGWKLITEGSKAYNESLIDMKPTFDEQVVDVQKMTEEYWKFREAMDAGEKEFRDIKAAGIDVDVVFDNFEQTLRDGKTQLKNYKDELSEVKFELKELTSMSFEGETSKKKEMFAIEQTIKQLKIEQLERKTSGRAYQHIDFQIEKQRDKLELLRLQSEVTWDSQREHVDLMGQDYKDTTVGVIKNIDDWKTNVLGLKKAEFDKNQEIVNTQKAIISTEKSRRDLLGDWNSIVLEEKNVVKEAKNIKTALERIPSEVNVRFNFSTNLSKIFGGLFGGGEIQKMQHGGIVTRPTLAMIGEAGPEAVVPLDRAGGISNTFGNITIIVEGASDPYETASVIREELASLS